MDCEEYVGDWTTSLNRFLSIPGASIYSDFVAMLKWTGVLDTLNNGGEYTLFLPFNTGFSKEDECFSLVALGLAKVRIIDDFVFVFLLFKKLEPFFLTTPLCEGRGSRWNVSDVGR